MFIRYLRAYEVEGTSGGQEAHTRVIIHKVFPDTNVFDDFFNEGPAAEDTANLKSYLIQNS